MLEDVKRLFRHLVPVGVMYGVSQGWVPAEMQAPLVEVGVVLSSIVVSLVWSRERDKQVGRV